MHNGHPSLCRLKEFGYSKIKWSIKNYFAATNENDWTLYSPCFTVHGDQCTCWQLSLKNNNVSGIKYISVYLTCLESSSKIRGNWKLFSAFDMHVVQCEIDYDFGKRKTYDMELCSAGRLEDVMKFHSTDTLTIKCKLIVYSKDRKLYDRPKDPGLKSLSQDMRVLYAVAKNYDITMLAGGEPVKAHKAVLCSRNDFLKDLIEKSGSEIELPNLTSEGVLQVIGYLYSGNLDYVLRTPSFSIYKCIKQLKMKELEVYYKIDSLLLCSEYKVKKHFLEWNVSNIDLDKHNRYVSAIFKEKYLDMSFRLHLYSEGFSERESEYVSIFIEIVEGKFHQIPYFEFVVRDSKESVEYLQRKRWSKEAKKFGLENFLQKDIFKEMTKDGCLRISCSVMFYSESVSSITEKISPAAAVETEHHYELLTKQISYLFESGLYSDITLQCEGGSFKVHSCILGARSYVLKILFEKSKSLGEGKSYFVPRFKYDDFMKVLSYIYNAKLVTEDVEEVLKLYKAAEIFGMLPLKYACSDVLQKKLDVSNISKVLILASTSKDYKLKTCVLTYLSKNSSEILRKMRPDINEQN